MALLNLYCLSNLISEKQLN